MKPKNRVYCHEAQRLKMLFDTEKEANTFIKFNGDQLTDNPENLRAYYCDVCGGYHITSHKYRPYYGQRTRNMISQYHEMGKTINQILNEFKTILTLHNNSIKFKKPRFKQEIREIIYEAPNIFLIYGYGDNITKDNITNVLDYSKLKTLLGIVKHEIKMNESHNNMKKDSKKDLYNQIMETVSKEVKKALNEDSILNDVTPVPGEQGVDCAKRLMNGIRRAYPEAAKFNGMKKAMLSILNNEVEINGFIRELRDQLKRENWHE